MTTRVTLDDILDAMLAIGTWASRIEVAAYLGRPPGSINRALAEAVDAGKVARMRRNGRKWPPSYRLR